MLLCLVCSTWPGKERDFLKQKNTSVFITYDAAAAISLTRYWIGQALLSLDKIFPVFLFIHTFFFRVGRDYRGAGRKNFSLYCQCGSTRPNEKCEEISYFSIAIHSVEWWRASLLIWKIGWEIRRKKLLLPERERNSFFDLCVFVCL